MRQFTPAEHARFKQIPPHLLGDASETMKHEMLGQSVVYEKFADVGHHIGNSVNRFAGRPEVEMENRVAARFQEQLGLDREIAHLASSVVEDLQRPEREESRYVGRIVAVRKDVVVQQVGDLTGILHEAVSLREIPKLGQAVEIRYRDGHAVVSALSPVDALPAPLSTDTPAVRSAKQRFRTEGMVASSEDKSTFEALPRSTRMRM